ncbi:hypothetical protein [Niabella sp.]|uniref:hypothetical protein n=1 Tax=Niabella sp. TaxID=1962976 RepID=UPI0026193DA5|nr:hypothetical protein [Niabella sp.]
MMNGVAENSTTDRSGSFLLTTAPAISGFVETGSGNGGWLGVSGACGTGTAIVCRASCAS